MMELTISFIIHTPLKQSNNNENEGEEKMEKTFSVSSFLVLDLFWSCDNEAEQISFCVFLNIVDTT